LPTILLSESVIQLLYHIFSKKISEHLELKFIFHIYLYIPFLWIANGIRMRESYKYQRNRFDLK